MLIYEMLAGYPPFYDEDAMNTYRKILRCNLQFPAEMSVAARDLIGRLVQVWEAWKQPPMGNKKRRAQHDAG